MTNVAIEQFQGIAREQAVIQVHQESETRWKVTLMKGRQIGTLVLEEGRELGTTLYET